MKPEAIIELYEMLGCENIVQRNDWMMASCPFSEWEHENGGDTRPSFGVSMSSPSFYNCFACGAKSPVSILPTVLAFKTGEDYSKIRRFIIENETVEFKPFDEIQSPNKKIGVMPESLLLDYKSLPPYDELAKLNIDTKIAIEYGLKFDPIRPCIVYPIRDAHGRFVGIRNRYTGTEYTPSLYYARPDLHPMGEDAKSMGIWYGMDKYKPDKPLVLVEGERDVLLTAQSGLVANVWGSMSASLSDRQVKTIQDMPIKIILFFDDDRAGHRATQKMRDKLIKLTRVYTVTDYQGCKDPAELVEKGLLGKALKSIRELK